MNRQQAIEEDEIDLKELFATLRRYKYMILTIMIVFTIGSAMFAYFQTSIYKTFSTVEVGLEKSMGGGAEDFLSMAMSPGAVNAETEMEIIKSRFLSEKAAESVDILHHYYNERHFKKIELYKDTPFQVGMVKGYDVWFELYPIDDAHYRLVVEDAEDENGTSWSYDKVLPYGKEIKEPYFHLNIIKKEEIPDEKYYFLINDPKDAGLIAQENVSVSQRSKGSSVLEISYEDNIPLRAQEFTNSLTKAYIEQNIERKTKEATLKLDFLDSQLKKIMQNLKSSAVKIEEFKKGSKMVNLSSKAEVIVRQISETEAKLEEVRMESEMLNRLYAQLKKGKHLESISVAGIGTAGKRLSEQLALLQDAIMKKKVLREDYTEMYPAVAKLRKQIAYLRKNIMENIKSLKNSINEKKAILESSIEKYQKKLNELPADERMFGQLQRNFSVNEKIYSYLLEKRSETAIMKAATVSQNRILDTALVPEKPIKPKRKLIVIVGMITGLILGIFAAFLRAFLDDRIQTEEDIEHNTNVPVLGFVPVKFHHVIPSQKQYLETHLVKS